MHEDHIRSARIRLWLAAIGGLTVLSLSLACLVFPIAWVLGAASNVLGTGYGFGWGLVAWAAVVSLGIAVPVSVVLFGWSLLHAEQQALTFVHAWPRPNGSARRPARLDPALLERVEHRVEIIAIAAGVTAPRVAAIVDDAPNCMTVGRSPERAWLVVTTGLVSSLSERELEAVLAYELGRIAELEVSLDTVVYALTTRSFELWVAAFSDVDHVVLLLLPLALLAVPFLIASVVLRGVALRNRRGSPMASPSGTAATRARSPGRSEPCSTIRPRCAAVTPRTRTSGSSTHTAARSRWFLRSHRILPRRIRRLERLAGPSAPPAERSGA